MLGLAVAAVVLIAAGLAYVATVGVNLELTRYRDRFAEQLAQRLNQPVALTGRIALRASLRPELVIEGISIGEPAVYLNHARLAIDAQSYWRERKIKLTTLEASDVTVALTRHADGSIRLFGPGASGVAHPAEPDVTVRAPAAGGNGAAAARLIELGIDRIALTRIAVLLKQDERTLHRFDLTDFNAAAPHGQPVKIKATGIVENTFPYALTIDAGALSGLVESDADWPIEASIEFLGSSLHAEGVVRDPGGRLQAQINFGLGTGELNEIERLFAIDLPELGVVALAGRVSIDGAHYQLADLTGNMGQTTVSGELSIDSAGVKPRISGQLSLPVFDAAPFLGQKTSRAPPKSLKQWAEQLSNSSVDLAVLKRVDADLKLAIGNWLSLPGDVHDASVHIRLAAGRLNAPMQVKVTGVDLTGELTAIDGEDAEQIELGLGARDSTLGGLAELLLGLHGVRGELNGFAFRVAADGRRLGDLVRNADIHLALSRGNFTFGNIEGGRPVAFTLDSFVLGLPSGGNLRADGRGTLLGQPLQLALTSSSLAKMLEGSVPFALQASSRSLRARIDGSWSDTDSAGSGSSAKFSISADRARDAAAWLNLTSAPNAPLALSGELLYGTHSYAARNVNFKLGADRIHIEAGQMLAPPGRKNAKPGPIRLSVQADSIDLKQWLDNKANPGAARGARVDKPAAAALGTTLDIPILPAQLNLADADLDIKIKRIAGAAVPIGDIAFTARLRDGQMIASPFSAMVLGTRFGGAIAFDGRTQNPSLELWLGTDDADIGAMLKELRLSSTIDATLKSLQVHALLRGQRLSELMNRADVRAEFNQGRVALRDVNTGAALRIEVDDGWLGATGGAAAKLQANGRVNNDAIQLELASGTLAELADSAKRVPIKLNATIAGARIAIDGNLARSLAAPDINLSLKLAGGKLAELSALAHTDLPPWGPYSLDGRLRISNNGYDVENGTLKIGSSTLTGSGKVDTVEKPPRLSIDLSATSIQLDDFRFGDWSPTPKSAAQSPPAQAVDPTSADEIAALRKRARAASEDAQRLVSQQILQRQNARLRVKVDEVRSGADRLGSGSLQAAIESGRAQIDPIEVELPGGSAKMALGWVPTAQSIGLTARIDVDRMDYGVLARRAKPGSDLSGKFSLHFDIASKAPNLADAMSYANGKLDVAVWPEKLRADVFDMWAANLLIALAQRADPASDSRINCGLGRFVLTDGKLEDRQIMLDTTRVRVTGKAAADFRDEAIRLRMSPLPKQAQFFSLATPIEVGGTFREYKIGVNPGDVIATVGRLATSLVVVPLQKLFGKDLPADGADVCTKQWLRGSASATAGEQE